MAYRKTPHLDARFQFRLTAPEKDHVYVQAKAAHMTPSAYGRSRLLGRPVIANTDMNTLMELRRQGGLFKTLHNESGGIYSAETAEGLRVIISAIRDLVNNGQT